MAQVAPDALGGAIPSNDPYETSFTTGQRNIFVSLAAAHGRFVRQRYANQYLQRLPQGWNTCIAHSLRRLEHGLLQLPVWFGQREQDYRQRSPDSVLSSPRLLRADAGALRLLSRPLNPRIAHSPASTYPFLV